MTVIERAQIKTPVLRKETAECEPLGGEVVVQAMTLTQRLALKGTSEDVPGVLAECVLAGDGKPVYDIEQWVVFGGPHAKEAMALFNKVMELSGVHAEAVKKNS